MSDSLLPYELQHARPPCPSPIPGAYPNSWHWVGDDIQSSHTLSSPSPPAPNPSQYQGLFQWVDSSHKVAKVSSFSFNISPSQEHPGLIFRMDWLDLLAVQGTLKSLLQHHSSKASIPRCLAFFTVQLSHPYMTIGRAGNYIQYPLINHNEKNMKKNIFICITKSLCCTVEINTIN